MSFVGNAQVSRPNTLSPDVFGLQHGTMKVDFDEACCGWFPEVPEVVLEVSASNFICKVKENLATKSHQEA